MLTKKTWCGLFLSVNLVLTGRTAPGLLILSSDTIQGGATPVTNLNVTKIATNGLRLDFGSASSIISFADQPLSLQLFHANKTYLWLPGNQVPAAASVAPLPPAFETVFEGYPAQLYCITNGLEFTHLWVVPITRFFPSNSLSITSLTPSPGAAENRQVGSFFDANTLVVGSESRQISPQLLSPAVGTNATAMLFTNLVITRLTKLVSITVTNLDAADFAPPQDYTEAKSPPMPTAINIDPARFGIRTNGLEGLEQVQRNSARGIPLLAWPQPTKVWK